MLIEQSFPALKSSGYRVTSPVTVKYNCIAWAAGDENRWWWPDANNQYYWPNGAPREETVEAFVKAFESLGFKLCDDLNLESGFEKVAIYSLWGIPTHAAKQLRSGLWTSKLGRLEDIEHKSEGIQGQAYGAVTKVLKRKTGKKEK